MSKIRVLHTGDLHIGNFPGPEQNGKNVRFNDICKCLDALVAGAKVQQPDIVVIAGDMFHQAKVWSDRGLKEQQTAVKFLRELEAICPVVVMRGTPNHDHVEQFNTLESTFYSDNNVHIVTEPGVGTYHSYDGKKIQIACLPGFDRGYYRAKNPGLSKDEESEVFTKSIENMIIGLKAQCKADTPAVLVSHYTIVECNMESGQTAFFSQFEPVVYPETLIAADFDLVCFGHIHRPQQLDGCKNTFYCGAISALNFNDEGQQRGYWIHDIEDKGIVTSTFCQLPTREYLTIHLEDNAIKEINENGPEWILNLPVLDNKHVVEGKLIRVLYNCTDEHNKAFNRTILANYLYSIGAFWVQEVTPQKILITVDRRSMEADNTPEGNLTDYLMEKGFTSEYVGEIIELARPIIAEATEKTMVKRHTGLFVPVEIEVKNYRNYQEEHFSFNDIRFCTINGRNGAGKSSLFMDAMTDALFEETRESELTGWICNNPGVRSGSIKFTFKLGESLYRVTRTRQKSGKGTLNIAEFVHGEWMDRSKEKLKDTQQEIINIIGIDSLTLKACALIMQDQYGLFLEADKEARINIIGNILGLGIYTRMEMLAADRVTETNRMIRSLADKMEIMTAELPDKGTLMNQINEIEEYHQNLKENVQKKMIEADSLKAKLNTQLEAVGRVIKLNSKISTLMVQKATKEETKTSQIGIITAANSILEEEAEITAGVANYNSLLEQEKELIKDKTTYDNLFIQKQQIVDAIMLSEHSVMEMRKKKSDLILMKIEPLQKALAREEELTAKHEKYEITTSQIKELEALEPEWKKLSTEVTTAEKEIRQLESNYEFQKTQLTTKILTLKGKVELLKDSGCPNIANASCKFLSDALKAKLELPEVEAAFDKLEQNYRDSCYKASEALSLAKRALDDSLYHPEKMKALRGVQIELEVAEKEYNSLKVQRNELKLITERIEELAVAMTDTEATVEKNRIQLAKVEKQLLSVAGASIDYDRLQKQIVEARQWLDKEKHLPIAKEQKVIATQRVLELTEEIETIEAEILAARAELEIEQNKTVGKEELQMQVNSVESEIRSLQAEVQSTTMTLGGLKKQAEQIEKKLAEAAEMQKQINEMGGKAARYEELKKAFSQDGIPHNIIRSIIPILEATATNILGQMSQGLMSVEFVTEKVLKSNSKKEVTTLDIIVNDSDTGRLPYMSRSGGERVKAALSVILALSEIKSSKAGIQLGFLFIDEPPFLDAPGVQAYCDALEAIQIRYPHLKVMAITHDPAMKSRFPQSIDVVKTPEGSKVIY